MGEHKIKTLSRATESFQTSVHFLEETDPTDLVSRKVAVKHASLRAATLVVAMRDAIVRGDLDEKLVLKRMDSLDALAKKRAQDVRSDDE